MASVVNDTLASMGRKGDTLIAHINPREAAILKAFGGKGGINPQTGFLEFYDDGDESSSASTDSFGGNFGADNFGGSFGADQGNLADTAMGGYEGWGAVGEHSFGDLDTSMGPQDPGYYSGATGMPGETGIPSASFTGGVQIGQTTEGLTEGLGGLGRAGLIGYGLAGIPGAIIGMGGYGLYKGATGWSSLSPAEQDEAIATANEAMPDRGGNDGGGGDYGITVAPEATFSATGTQPSGKRTIIDNLTNRFNRGVTRTL